MREIKVRAWEKISNRWAKWDEIGITASKTDITTFRPDWNDTRKEFEIQQFTGLKDKNGKEIYEGDLLKDDNNLYLIKWSEKQAGFMIDRKGWMYDHFITEMNELKELEVIGNIFENPELLQAKRPEF